MSSTERCDIQLWIRKLREAANAFRSMTASPVRGLQLGSDTLRAQCAPASVQAPPARGALRASQRWLDSVVV